MVAKRILIVEGIESVAREVHRVLSRHGYAPIDVVATGDEALRKSAAERPDLVLMDMALDGSIDSIETAQRIGARFDVPVVYLAASKDQAMLRLTAAIAPFGYLVKPVDEGELRTTVEKALYRHRMERDLRWCRQQIASLLTATFDGIIVTDRDGLVEAINAVASDLTEWSLDDAIGKDWAEIFKTTEPLPSDLATLTRDVFPDENLDGVSFAVLLTESGRRIPVEHRSAPVTDPHGDVEGTVLAFRALRA